MQKHTSSRSRFRGLRPNQQHRPLWTSLAFLLGTCIPHAQAFDIDVSGFGTFGLVQSDSTTLGFQSSLTAPAKISDKPAILPDSNFGMQFGASISERLDATLQMVFRDRYGNSLANSINRAMLRYQFTPSTAIRVGRIGQDVFMMSEYKEVGLAYLWARPSMEYYGTIAFNHMDGFNLQHTLSIGDGQLEASMFGGRATAPLGTPDDYADIKMDSIYGVKLSWENEQWLVRATYANLNPNESDLNDDFKLTRLADQLYGVAQLGWAPAADVASDLLISKQDKFDYYSLAALYDMGQWFVQGEIARINSGMSLFPGLTAYYLGAGYSVEDVTYYALTSSASYNNEPNTLPSPAETPAPFQPLIAIVDQTYDSSLIDQSSMSLGMRWNIFHDLALKIQWDRYNVEKTGLWQTDPASSGWSLSSRQEKQTVNVYSVNLSFIF